MSKRKAPKEETLGFWVEGDSFRHIDEVMAIFQNHLQAISEKLGIQPSYDEPGPWRGYTGEPPSVAVCTDYAKAIRFAIWHGGTSQESGLFLTASDADTWLTLVRVTT